MPIIVEPVLSSDLMCLYIKWFDSIYETHEYDSQAQLWNSYRATSNVAENVSGSQIVNTHATWSWRVSQSRFSSIEKTELEGLMMSMDGTLQGQAILDANFVIAKDILATHY
jgi:hypothetical protein